MHKLESEILLFFVKLFVPASDEPEAVAEQDKMSSRDGGAGCVGDDVDVVAAKLPTETGPRLVASRIRYLSFVMPLCKAGTD